MVSSYEHWLPHQVTRTHKATGNLKGLNVSLASMGILSTWGSDRVLIHNRKKNQ